MDKEHKPGEGQQPEPATGPDEALRWKAIPEAEDTEAHAIRSGRGATPDTDEPSPDTVVRGRPAVPDAEDAEAHAFRINKSIPEAADAKDATDAEGHGMRYK